MAGKAVSRANEDGSLDVWVEGWHVHFPAGGAQPTAERGGPPDPAPRAASGVKVVSSGSEIHMARGAWVVMLGSGPAVVLPLEPEDGGGNYTVRDYGSHPAYE